MTEIEQRIDDTKRFIGMDNMFGLTNAGAAAIIILRNQLVLLRAVLPVAEMWTLLVEASETLDNYSDVVDGEDSQPRANDAMSMKARIDAFLAKS